MKDEYDFSSGKRGAIASSKGKTRITSINLFEVEALEQQLIAVAGELNRVLRTPKPTKAKDETAQ
ncbi:hypothetical protein QFZ45_003766 [Pseudomonas synxantha]|nr:hypothetical protein [Pseudomonas synxantha]MDQ0980588.1 hypothetical protein [Pseudomonas synxantha]